MPKISVILPVYNTEKYIRESVQSILNQTFTDFELIIINDASTDNTSSILHAFTDDRIRIINNPVNQGIAKNANIGLDEAKGEFLARIDADDIACENRLEQQFKFLNEHPDIDLCGTWVELIGSENRIVYPAPDHDDIKAGLLFLNVIFNPSVMYRLASFKSNSLRYDESYRIEDYPLWIEAIDKIKFANVPKVLQKYRMHTTNISVFQQSNLNALNEFHQRVYKEIFKKLKIAYTEEDLTRHRKISLKQFNKIDVLELRACLKWLKEIVVTNRNVKYYKPSSLRNEVLDHTTYILKTAEHSFSSLISAFIFLISTFSLFEYTQYLQKKNMMRKVARHSNINL